jgi:Zn-dependent alcohol dehydrogenase
MQGRLQLDYLISDHIRLSDVNMALENLRSGAPVRQVIDMSLS